MIYIKNKYRDKLVNQLIVLGCPSVCPSDFRKIGIVQNHMGKWNLTLIHVARGNAPSFSSISIKNQTKIDQIFQAILTFIKFTLVTSTFLSIRSVFDADSEKIVQKIFGGLITQIFSPKSQAIFIFLLQNKWSRPFFLGLVQLLLLILNSVYKN